MSSSVTETVVSGQPTAVIAAATTWVAFPKLWASLLDEVWAAVRSSADITPNRNVMLYRDEVPNVEIGVEVEAPFQDLGRVVSSSLPAGRVVTTTHRGRYEDLGEAHDALIDWCDRRGLTPAWPRWEVYGHWKEHSAEQEVEVYHLLS